MKNFILIKTNELCLYNKNKIQGNIIFFIKLFELSFEVSK